MPDDARGLRACTASSSASISSGLIGAKHIEAGELGFIPLAHLVKAHVKGVPNVMPVMAPDKDIPDIPKDRYRYRVQFNGEDDKQVPFNWSRWDKLLHIFMACYAGMAVMWGVSDWASAEKFMKPIYHLAWAVCGLGISLYLFSLLAGGALWVPLSDLYGRRPILVASMLGAMAFSWWTSTAQYYYQFLIYRFFTGLFGSGALSIVVNIFQDLSDDAGVVDASISVYSFIIFGSPVLAPWVSDVVAFSFLGWRWIFTLQAIMMSLGFALILLFFKETCHPLILQSKARELRIRTGNRFIYCPQDHTVLDFSVVLHNFLVGPIRFFMADPILMAVSFYQGFLFALLYLTMEGIPVTFQKYGWEKDLTAICSLSMLVGMIIAAAFQVFVTNPYYRRALSKRDISDCPPLRLWVMLPGAIVLPMSLFWWFWTGFYRVHWICPTIAMAFTGFGLVTAFAPALNFVYVSYVVRPEIAMGANAFTRAIMMGVCPFFVKDMYFTLGLQWSGTLLGCLAVLLGAMPYVVFWLIPLMHKNNDHKAYRKNRWEKIMSNQIIKKPLTTIESRE